MSLFRRERLESRIQKALAEELLRSISFDGVLVTLVDVRIDEKFEEARVRIAVIPDEKKQEVLESLNKQASTLQYALLKKIPVGRIPRLEFK